MYGFIKKNHLHLFKVPEKILVPADAFLATIRHSADHKKVF